MFDFSIVMVYNDTKKQTLQTLKRFEKLYAKKYSLQVIIVDNNSNTENKLNDDIKEFTYTIDLIQISKEESNYKMNPCIAFNEGFNNIKGNIVIIQNSECYHVSNILEYTKNNLSEQDYFTYSCFSSDNSDCAIKIFNNNEFNLDLINDKFFLNKNLINYKWYNHPVLNPTKYHFCSAIFKSKLELIGGFDKKFADGYGYSEDEFLLTIEYNLKLKIHIIPPSKCFVFYQYNEINTAYKIDKIKDINISNEKLERNKKLFENKKKNHEKVKFNYPKLMFLYWDGSSLSMLNYLTILSFNKYNLEWKIIIYLPIKRELSMSWKTNEQKIKYEGKCYFNYLKKINNISILHIDFDKIGFNNNISEVIKSDYVRYYLLHKHGGVWSDFDIIYTASIEKKMNFKDENIIFYCKGYKRPKKKEKEFYYYPIGFLISKQKSKFYKYILEKCKKYYDKNNYQCIGATMFKKLFKEKLFNIRICNEDYYLPWAYNELYEFLDPKYINNKLPSNNIGIHWFNGAKESKMYSINLEKRLNNFKAKCYLDNIIKNYLPIYNPEDLK